MTAVVTLRSGEVVTVKANKTVVLIVPDQSTVVILD